MPESTTSWLHMLQRQHSGMQHPSLRAAQGSTALTDRAHSHCSRLNTSLPSSSTCCCWQADEASQLAWSSWRLMGSCCSSGGEGPRGAGEGRAQQQR